jgi:putative (di)nucleoside polyphosphate hydrolase
MNSKYRPCAGIIVLNDNNQIFAGRSNKEFEKNWQMPQGGIEENENAFDAAMRELHEETGIKNIDLLKQTDDWIYYDVPEKNLPSRWQGKYIGQKQKWFLVRFTGDESEIDLEIHKPEFSEWKWTTPEFLIEKTPPFKTELYKKIFKMLITK